MVNDSYRYRTNGIKNYELKLDAGNTLKLGGGGQASPEVQGNLYPKLKTAWI